MNGPASHAQAPAQNRWIADIKKNGREVVRVELSNYRGTDLVNLRVWFDAGAGEMRPARDGFALKVEKLPELQDAVSRAIDAARQERLL